MGYISYHRMQSRAVWLVGVVLSQLPSALPQTSAATTWLSIQRRCSDRPSRRTRSEVSSWVTSSPSKSTSTTRAGLALREVSVTTHHVHSSHPGTHAQRRFELEFLGLRREWLHPEGVVNVYFNQSNSYEEISSKPASTWCQNFKCFYVTVS